MAGLIDSRLIRREFIAGGTAGGIGIFLGFPFDLIKVNLQTNPDKYGSAWQCYRQIIKAEGYAGLYRGCIPPVMMQGLINSLIFTGESVATKILEPNLLPGEVASPINAFLAGSVGGITQCVVLVPSEVVKCTMQAGTLPPSVMQAGGTGSSINKAFVPTINTVKHIVKYDGILGLYKGLGVTMAREIPAIGTYFFCYKYIRSDIHQRQGGVAGSPVSTFATLTAGALAGALAWVAVYPFDVIKTNMQTVAAPAEATQAAFKSKTFLGVGAELYRARGAGVFYRGLSTAVVRALPVNAAIFYIYEQLKTTGFLQ